MPETDPDFKPDETARPAAVRIATDEYHLEHFGKNDEGLIVWTGTQLKYDFATKKTTDYTFKFLFDTSGEVVSSEIETVGIRSAENQKNFAEKMNSLVSANKIVAPANVMIKTFTVVHEGVEFGLIVRVPEEPEDVWAVEFMPGNTLAFFEPFDSGFYDT